MTVIKFAVIDNKKKKKGHSYTFLFCTDNINDFIKYIKEKGLLNDI